MSHFSVLVLTREGQDVEGLLLPYMENCCGEPPREYMEFFEDEECEVDEETGRRGYWQNPNARWDWYEVGGRFRGMLRASSCCVPIGCLRRRCATWAAGPRKRCADGPNCIAR